jgi:protein-tyrosine phosphatase
MTRARTSQSHPLQIAEVRASASHGRIGITFCPGKHDPSAITGAWARDLATDLDAIAAWGAQLVLTLVEAHELRSLKVPDLGREIEARGIAWRHLPIADFSIPDDGFERQWVTEGREARALLRRGADVLVHCKGGLGRAGMIAARLLVELGVPSDEAIRAVRRVRKGAIETSAQLALVRRTAALTNEEGDASPADPPVIDTGAMRQVGGSMGSNPGGVHEDADGRRYYVKTLETPAHARNEFVAAALYRLAGAPILTYVKTRAPNQVATRLLRLDKRDVAHLSEDERRQAQRWFGVHAWMANWDAAGFDGDNQGVVDGTVLTLDVGGALEFRAQGDPKGKAFGTRVDELDALRGDRDNPHAVRLFGDMGEEDIRKAIRVVTDIPDDRIREVILDHGGAAALADKMIDRKADMRRRSAGDGGRSG